MARTSRRYEICEKENGLDMKDIYMVGIYARISVDFNEHKADSIDTQIKLARNYILKKNEQSRQKFIIYDIYSDSGKTGTNFEREGFERLMCDIRNGKVNCIVVKDFSRFGRNYLETDHYIQTIFPFLRVRFISINDEYDSALPDSCQKELSMNIKNLVNDMYSKDISKKVSVSRRTASRNGDYVGSNAPYGYAVTRVNGKKKLVVVPEQAEIVRFIYQSYADGKSMKEIKNELFERRVHRGSDLKRYGHVYCQEGEHLHEWGDSSIRAILQRGNYCGNLVQHRMESGFMTGEKHCHGVDKKEWIIVKNTHESIVSEELFERVQKRMKQESSKKVSVGGEAENPRVCYNVMYCGDCGRKLTAQCSDGYWSYFCGAYRYRDKRKCSKKSISDLQVQRVLRDEISIWLKKAELKNRDFTKIADKILKEKQMEYDMELRQIERQFASLSRKKSEQFFLYKDGKITKEEYLSFRENITMDECFLNNRKAEVEDMKKKAERQIRREKKFFKALLDADKVTELNTEIVESLVDKICLYEDKRLEIHFKITKGDRNE